MKKTLIILISLFTLLISSCQINYDVEENDKIKIITTIFPQYDFAKNIAGDFADITMLLAPGQESHTYEPTPQEIVKINSADIFIYTGGVSDSWIDNILKDSQNTNLKIINLADICMINSDTVYDEHVWTSPKNAIEIVKNITDVLIEIDPDNEQFYKNNSSAYLEKLKQIDKSIEETVATSKRNLLVFADRFPFYHLAKDYNLEYISAFSGCSEHTEPDIKTIENIIKVIKTQDIPNVFTIEFSNEKLADVISEETGCKKSVLHSCHNVTSEEIKSNVSYIGIMQENINVLKEALN